MIAAAVRAKLVYGLLPANQCAHCGYVEDPACCGNWPEDSDGDAYCHDCEDAEEAAQSERDDGFSGDWGSP